MQVFDNKDYFVIPVVLIVFTFVIIYAIKESIRLKKNYKATGKKWLFESITGQFGGAIHFLNIGIYAPLFSHSDEEWTLTSQFVFSFFVVLYVLFFYIALKIVSPKLKEKLSKEHPEYHIFTTV
jgi:hypothetical protein